LIFIDEAGFNIEMDREYGWSVKGKRFTKKAKPKSLNYSVIAAVTSSRLLCYLVSKEAMLQETFYGFLVEIVEYLIEEGYYQNYVLLFDNAKIH